RCDLLVFREGAGRARYPSATLLNALQDLLQQAFLNHGEQRKTLLTNSLLRAGEIECALADLQHPAARKAEPLTGALAKALLFETADLQAPLSQLRTGDLPDSLAVTSPEGFAYYSLDPLRYEEVINGLNSGPAFVVGIRSIGTVLSAVCAAAL